MRVIDPGHHFALDSLDGEIKQTLQFVKRVGDKYPGNEEPAYPGCTSQEVLRALIARAQYVNNQHDHDANRVVIQSCRSALHALELRAAELRGELREFWAAVSSSEVWIEHIPVCATCGHVACGKHK